MPSRFGARSSPPLPISKCQAVQHIRSARQRLDARQLGKARTQAVFRDPRVGIDPMPPLAPLDLRHDMAGNLHQSGFVVIRQGQIHDNVCLVSASTLVQQQQNQRVGDLGAIAIHRLLDRGMSHRAVEIVHNREPLLVIAAALMPLHRPRKYLRRNSPRETGMIGFFLGLGLMCASTLMYEITLTRLLSVTCWYYLAFVSVSMAMFGMTAGALAVQLRPALFDRSQVRLRMAQAAFAMAVSMPIVLMIMFAIPLDISFAVQTVCSFLIFCSFIAVPFFFAGIVVCLSLTKASAPIGRVYFADLMGAAAGCFGSVILLNLVDAPSAVMVISALVFLSASAYAEFAAQPRLQRRCYIWAGVLVVLAALNASTIHGIQPIWSKGKLDPRTDILYETWNPISRVRVVAPKMEPRFVGPQTPPISSEVVYIDIDNDAATGIYRFQGDLKDVDFLRYEVNSMGARMRAGGSAAIIGVGGGRDVMACALFGFHRIVGIEINSSIVDVTSRRMAWYSGFDKIPNFELHNDEGRSYLTRSHEKFDLIQATVVDTWAATAAGAMALTENSLYSLDGWRIFYDHLKPAG